MGSVSSGLGCLVFRFNINLTKLIQNKVQVWYSVRSIFEILSKFLIPVRFWFNFGKSSDKFGLF